MQIRHMGNTKPIQGSRQIRFLYGILCYANCGVFSQQIQTKKQAKRYENDLLFLHKLQQNAKQQHIRHDTHQNGHGIDGAAKTHIGL